MTKPTYLEHTDEDALIGLLVGRRIVRATRIERDYGIDDGELELDNGTVLTLTPNWGCGGCAAGEYQLDEIAGFDNVITRAELVDEVGEYEDQHTYRLFVYAGHEAINAVTISGDDEGGYYGTGFSVEVKYPA